MKPIEIERPPKAPAVKKINPVVHFEMPTTDRERTAKFYHHAFGWESNMLGEEMGNYTVVMTTDCDDSGKPKTPGTINGGFFLKDEMMPAQYPSVVIAVDDIRESMLKITNAGGKVIGEPVDIPGVGAYVSFFDTEGNRVSILQPLMV